MSEQIIRLFIRVLFIGAGIALAMKGGTELKVIAGFLIATGIYSDFEDHLVADLDEDDDEDLHEEHNLDNSMAAKVLEALPWRCFHCNFVTSDPEEAEAHFGERDDAEEFTPICKWWSNMDADERGEVLQDTLKELNSEREYSAKLRVENENLEYKARDRMAEMRVSMGGYPAFKNCDSLQDIFNLYDSMEGRALAAEERLASASAWITKYVNEHFCQCETPYFGAQVVGTPLRCERCQREVNQEATTK